jgi:hypothetical protein
MDAFELTNLSQEELEKEMRATMMEIWCTKKSVDRMSLEARSDRLNQLLEKRDLLRRKLKLLAIAYYESEV